MDCDYGSGIDDFCVPKDQEISDRLPSPGSWSQWGISSPEYFMASNKRFATNANVTSIEQLDFDGRSLSDAVEMENSFHDKDLSSGSSVFGGLLDESSQQTAISHGQPEYQFALARVEEMDDIFLNSLMEDGGNEDVYKSFCFSPESQYSILPTDNQSNSESISGDKHSMGSSKYLKTHAFSPSVSWGEGEASDSQFSSFYSEEKDCPSTEAPSDTILVPSEYNISNGPVWDERSLEESVLQELETVMAKLTDSTRMCFRDACYRLAKNSEQNPVSQDGEYATEFPTPSWTENDEQPRHGRKQETELATNTIDRAIANLMFNKMDINVVDFPVGESMNAQSKQKATGAKGLSCNSNKPRIHHSHHSPTLTSDSNVAFLAERHPQKASNQPTYFLGNCAGNM